jgi:hypothetical protein
MKGTSILLSDRNFSKKDCSLSRGSVECKILYSLTAMGLLAVVLEKDPVMFADSNGITRRFDG